MESRGGVARCRLAEERREWRKRHPHGFMAKPETLNDGSVNLMLWKCVVPGKEGTDWEGGYFPLTIICRSTRIVFINKLGSILYLSSH
ncbi:hypothetical protein EJB05_54884, partial [Eragrostis curvula]